MTYDEYEEVVVDSKVVSNQVIIDDLEVPKRTKGVITEIDTWAFNDEPDILVYFEFPVNDEVWCMYSEIDLVKE